MQLTNHKNKPIASHRELSNEHFGAVSNILVNRFKLRLSRVKKSVVSFNREGNFVGCIKLGLMVFCDYAKL